MSEPRDERPQAPAEARTEATPGDDAGADASSPEPTSTPTTPGATRVRDAHDRSPDDPTTPPPPPRLASRPRLPGSPTKRAGTGGLMLAALGVVFGDIGTSPLYSLQTVFNIDNRAVAPSAFDVMGMISMVFWSITAIVSVKYVALVMRADNEGEGGILALTALMRRVLHHRAAGAVTLLGIIGAGLFYGDSVITPAISVMSAVEGLEVVNPDATRFVVPIAVTILTLLFVIQKFGTAKVGVLFGPVMVLWFLTLAAMGVPQVVAHPEIIGALSPHHALAFVVERPFLAFIALGAVVLTITGAEALYADMGHFGAAPIRLAWFVVVLPCLTLNYLGQGALIIHHPESIDNPFFHLAEGPLVVPIVVLATAATVIASQAVISGAYSVTQQALHLGFMPRITVRHTSKEAGGQIYVPAVNWALFLGVLVLVVGFRSSSALANAYGLAVTGTLILTTILFGGLAHRVWRWPLSYVVPFMLIIGGLEVGFFAGNITKIIHGGWLPVLIAGLVVFVMTTWLWGVALVRAKRATIEEPLEAWLQRVRENNVTRVPGQAIYLHSNQETVPLALKETLRFNHVVHERIAITTVQVLNVPHVRHVDRVQVSDLGDPDDGIVGIVIRLGFNDSQDVPHNLRWSHGKDPSFRWDPAEARYYLSYLTVFPTEGKGWNLFRKRVYVLLGRLAGSRIDAFHLPPNRTAVLGGTLKI